MIYEQDEDADIHLVSFDQEDPQMASFQKRPESLGREKLELDQTITKSETKASTNVISFHPTSMAEPFLDHS